LAPTVGQVNGPTGSRGAPGGVVSGRSRPIASSRRGGGVSPVDVSAPQGSALTGTGGLMGAVGVSSLSPLGSGTNGGSIPALPGPLGPFGSLTGSSDSFSGPTVFAILT